MDGWKSPGGVKYRAAYGAINVCTMVEVEILRKYTFSFKFCKIMIFSPEILRKISQEKNDSFSRTTSFFFSFSLSPNNWIFFTFLFLFLKLEKEISNFSSSLLYDILASHQRLQQMKVAGLQ